MKDFSQYSFYVGTIRGVLAHAQQCKPDEPVHFELADTEKSEITALEWGRSDDEIIVGHKNGVVKLYNTLNNKYTKQVDNLSGENSVVGIGVQAESIIAGRYDGTISIFSTTSTTSFSLNLQQNDTLEAMVQNKMKPNLIGTGGEHNDFKLWDVENHKAIFKAKSMGHDELNLPIPTSIRGICFLPGEANLAVCATKEGHVLLYDDRVQRRPVTKFLEPKASYSALTATYREKQCVVGTTKGYIQLIDLKSPTKCLKTYKSFTGGVTSLVCDSISPIVVSTSLDRYIRIHNLDTKECLFKKYMKQSLTKLVIKPSVKSEPKEEVKNESDPEQIDEEYEELFEQMETVIDDDHDKRKKKRSTVEHKSEKLRKKKKLCKV